MAPKPSPRPSPSKLKDQPSLMRASAIDGRKTVNSSQRTSGSAEEAPSVASRTVTKSAQIKTKPQEKKNIPAKRQAPPDVQVDDELVTPSKRKRVPSRAAIDALDSQTQAKSSRRLSSKKGDVFGDNLTSDNPGEGEQSKIMKKPRASKTSKVVISDDDIPDGPASEVLPANGLSSGSGQPANEDDDVLQQSGEDILSGEDDGLSARDEEEPDEAGSETVTEDLKYPQDDEGIQDDDIIQRDEVVQEDEDADPNIETRDEHKEDEDDHFEGDEMYDRLQEWPPDDSVAIRSETGVSDSRNVVVDIGARSVRGLVGARQAEFLIDLEKMVDFQMAALSPLIERGLLSCRRQVTSALNFLSDGVYINPSRADPGLVKTVDTGYGNKKDGERLVMRNGPAASSGNAVFVSVIVVEDVKLREAVFLSGGNSDRKQKRVTGCLFHGESELKSGFFGAAFSNLESASVSREAGADIFATKMSPRPNIPSPTKRSRFTERAAKQPQIVHKAIASPYRTWPAALPHDSSVPVYDFTQLTVPFDFSEEAWSKIDNCPSVTLRFGDDQIGSDDVIALVGYTASVYGTSEDLSLNQNILFLAVLARVGGIQMPLIDRVALQTIQDYGSQGGDLNVHPSSILDAAGSKGKGKITQRVRSIARKTNASSTRQGKAPTSKKVG
ncbi:hypothetical protein EYR38_003338 [Pleurotus pulmonarius]|nr:hypothetical protein EYR38_003338 [Pleurotus pulmonarius]